MEVQDPGAGFENNCIQYITIATTGNSQDFGDLITNRNRSSGACHRPEDCIWWRKSTHQQEIILILLLYLHWKLSRFWRFYCNFTLIL